MWFSVALLIEDPAYSHKMLGFWEARHKASHLGQQEMELAAGGDAP